MNQPLLERFLYEWKVWGTDIDTIRLITWLTVLLSVLNLENNFKCRPFDQICYFFASYHKKFLVLRKKKTTEEKKTLSTGGLGQQIMYLQENLLELSELNTLEKRQYLPHYWSDKGFKVTVVNRTLPSVHGGSLEKNADSPFNHANPIFLEILLENCETHV